MDKIESLNNCFPNATLSGSTSVIISGIDINRYSDAWTLEHKNSKKNEIIFNMTPYLFDLKVFY